MPPSTGSHPLTGTSKLPNVTVAFPGEHWSDWTASGTIVPGEAIVPAGADSKGRGRWKVADNSDAIEQMAIALRPVDHPDVNNILGPNEIRNTPIAAGEYVHSYHSGSFQLTLVVPDTYEPGDLIGWDADGVRPEGKADGTGAWAKDADTNLFEVQEVRQVGSDDEVILSVRSLRGQF